MVIVCNCVAPPLAYRASILLYRAGKTLIFPPPLNRPGADSVYFTVCWMFFCPRQACRDRVLPALTRRTRKRATWLLLSRARTLTAMGPQCRRRRARSSGPKARRGAEWLIRQPTSISAADRRPAGR